ELPVQNRFRPIDRAARTVTLWGTSVFATEPLIRDSQAHRRACPECCRARQMTVRPVRAGRRASGAWRFHRSRFVACVCRVEMSTYVRQVDSMVALFAGKSLL